MEGGGKEGDDYDDDDDNNNYEDNMFSFSRGAFPRLRCLILDGSLERGVPIAHVAYAMDHGYLPVSLRLELAGHAAALAEEAAWKEGEEKEEEEGDEDGCKSERWLRSESDITTYVGPRPTRIQPMLSVEFRKQFQRGVSPRAILLWREALSQARVLQVQDRGSFFGTYLDDAAGAITMFHTNVLSEGRFPLHRLRSLWFKTPLFPLIWLDINASYVATPAPKTLLQDGMSLVLMTLIKSAPNLRGLDVAINNEEMILLSNLVIPAGCLPKLRALALRTTMDDASYRRLIRVPGHRLTVLSLDSGKRAAGRQLLMMAGLARNQDENGAAVNQAEDFLPPRLLRSLRLLRIHAANAPLDGSTLHLEGLLNMVRFSPRLCTLWLRSEAFGAFDPFITHFVNLAHMSATAGAAAAGSEDGGDDDGNSGFLSPHLKELDILPSSTGMTEGGKWLLLAWLRKQQGAARYLYLPGWVKGRKGEVL